MTGENFKFKLDIAGEVGADIVIDPGKEDVLEKIKDLNEGEKADIVMPNEE